MPLSAGTRLGPYEILAPLAAGGMGEVYRARDPRMKREVAIKLSAARFSDRFEHEVHAVAALNHPNICQIYDVGPNYLVMELIEGSTLAERIKKGALGLEESLAIAHQIADALEAAHDKRIIHRDLKPANIKITPDGLVKVLDFGLAKIAEPNMPAAGDPESTPTMTAGVTEVGHVVGTAAYMAPEQARGQALDKRADIWAFGVVLYEMITGRRLFDGASGSDTLAAVLNKEPEWEGVPAKAQRLLKSCLEKDPKLRLRDIGDAWRLLEDAPLPAGSNMRWKIVAGGSLALALALAIALWALWRGSSNPVDQPSTRLDLDLGSEVSLWASIGPAVILSPDGTRLVFNSEGSDGTSRLFTRRLDQPKAVQLPGTGGAYAPFFSPDGEWVGFFAQGKLKKTRVDGGEPVALCDAPAGRGASWGEDGKIVAALETFASLSQISPEAGTPVSVTELAAGEISHRWPHVLPGGKAVLFMAGTEYGNYGGAAITVVSLKDHRRKTLLAHGGMYPRYIRSGHLVYVTKGTLFAAPFDLDSLEVRGPAVQLGEVSGDPTFGIAQIDFSRSGTLAYRTGSGEGLRSIQWLDGAGKIESLGIEPASYLFPRLSPDGSRLALLMNQGPTSDLFVYDWTRGNRTRLSSGVNTYPVWTPDGRFLVFQSAGGMFWTRSDGGGRPQRLTQSQALQLPTSFTSDGTRLVFTELSQSGGGTIRTVSVESRSGELKAGEPEAFFKTPTTTTANAYAAFSPNGHWLAFANTPAGRYEVFVRAFPDNGKQVQISNAGGMMPVWSPNGHELFYRTEDHRIMVVNYLVKGESFVGDKPRVWFGKQLANLGLSANFDLAPDGKRIVALMPAEKPGPRDMPNHVTLVVNFFDEIRRRMAAQSK